MLELYKINIKGDKKMNEFLNAHISKKELKEIIRGYNDKTIQLETPSGNVRTVKIDSLKAKRYFKINDIKVSYKSIAIAHHRSYNGKELLEFKMIHNKGTLKYHRFIK